MHSQICNFLLIQMPPFLLLPENVSSVSVSTIHLHDCKRAKALPVCWEIHQEKFLFFIKHAGGHAVWAQLRCSLVPVTRWGSGEVLPGLATFVGAAITVTCSSAMCFINPLARHELRSNICTGGRCSSLRNGLLHAPSLCPTSPCLSPAFSLASPRVWGQPKWQPAPGPLGRLQEVGDGDKLQREIPKRLGVWQRGPEYPDLACGIKRWSRLNLVLSDLPLSAWASGTAIPVGSSVPGSVLLSPIFYAQTEKRVLWVFASSSRRHVCKDACVVLNQSEDVTRSSQWITK